MNENEVGECRHRPVLQQSIVHHPLFGEVQVVIHTLALQFIAHAEGSDMIAKTDAHGVPAKDVVISLLNRPLIVKA